MAADLDATKTVSLEELMVSTLAMADAVTKLLIEKGLITEAEFTKKLPEERESRVWAIGTAACAVVLLATWAANSASPPQPGSGPV